MRPRHPRSQVGGLMPVRDWGSKTMIALAGLICVALSAAMLWFAWPKNAQRAAFLTNEVLEVGYTLVMVFLLTGGLGGMLIGYLS